MPDGLWQIGSQLGFGGLLLAYMVWKETNERKDRVRREDEHAIYKRELLDAKKDETESRNKLATSLSALATIITGRPHV